MKKTVTKNIEIPNFHSAHKFVWEKGFLNKGESHHPWELVFVHEGKVQATENFQVYTLNKGDLIFHAPMEFHSISSPDNVPTCVYISAFEIEGEVPKELSQGVFSLSVDEFDEFERIFEKCMVFSNVIHWKNNSFKIDTIIEIVVIEIIFSFIFSLNYDCF